MGFGPRARDQKAARTAIHDLLELLYPEHATAAALQVLDRLAVLLMDNGAPLSFPSMARALSDPVWRESLLEQSPDTQAYFSPHQGAVIDPVSLDPDFAWLLRDRLMADPGTPLL